MAAPIYCTHKELKRVFPQLDTFDGKKQIYTWVETSSNLWVSYDTGNIDSLFIDGQELGGAEATVGAVSSGNKWFYDSDSDKVTLYITSDPNTLLIEAGEDFTTLVTQFRTDASRYLDSMIDPNMPRESWKDKNNDYDYIIIRTTALLAASFMIKTHDPNSELANALMEEADLNINNINDGKAALSWQVTRDSSQGVLRDVTFPTSGNIRPVDTRGEWQGGYDLIKIKITTAGALGAGKYSVWVKDSDKLKSSKVIDDDVIVGDYQPLAGGLQIRFGGANDTSVAELNNEWELEVFGKYEHTDTTTGKAVKMTRIKKHGRMY